MLALQSVKSSWKLDVKEGFHSFMSKIEQLFKGGVTKKEGAQTNRTPWQHTESLWSIIPDVLKLHRDAWSSFSSRTLFMTQPMCAPRSSHTHALHSWNIWTVHNTWSFRLVSLGTLMLSKTTYLFPRQNCSNRLWQHSSWPEACLLQTLKVRSHTKTANVQTAEGHHPNIPLRS